MTDTKTDALVKPSDATTALAALPDWITAGDTTGTEMTADDMKLPRLSIAQGLSPQVIEGDSAYIPDLKFGAMFNDLSQEVYGRGPLTFIAVRHDIRRIQFKPREEGGGVIDMNVGPNDARNEWTNDEKGVRVPPLATKFDEYVIMLVTETGLEPIVLSIKHTNKFNREAIRRLNSFIGMPTKLQTTKGVKRVQLPIYGKLYTIESKNEKKDTATYGVPVIGQAGVVTDAAMGNQAMEFAKRIAGKTIVIEREPGADDFDPTEIEGVEAGSAPKM